MAVVSTVSPARAFSEPLYEPQAGAEPHRPLCQDSGYGLEKNATAEEHETSLEPCRLHVSIMDLVSGKMLYRVTHAQSTGPVHAVINENFIVYTYWNSQLKRPELSSIGLFEGIIDKYGLTPFASHSSAAAAAPHISAEAGTRTSFGGQTPLAAQRTYVLPHVATALSVTQSARGIANKNILLAFASGQVFSVDMRQIHPRRPLTEPSQPEKEEGLTQYNPFLHLVPFQAVTLDGSVNGVHFVTSRATRLESTTLVFSYGGPDLHFARTQSSGGFDLLASEFNKPLLLLILVGLVLVAVVLRVAYFKKIVAAAWA